MPADPNQQQPSGGSSMDYLWGVVAVVFVCVSVWYFFRDHLIRFVLEVKILELELLDLFNHDLYGLKPSLEQYRHSPDLVTLPMLGQWLTQIGSYFSIPVTAILLVLAVIVYFSHPSLKFKTTYSMQSLLEHERDNWPQVSIMTDNNLIDVPLTEGPWASAVRPMEFAKQYKLIIDEDKLAIQYKNPKEQAIASINRDKSATIFKQQLGRLWAPEFNKHPKHELALFALFATRINRDTETAYQFARQLAFSAGRGSIDYSGTNKLLRKYANSQPVTEILQKHAYRLTIMASMLEAARIDGVQATADFLWLKPLDRTLWYMLNNVGRQTAFVEVAGPFAHWLAEKAVGVRLTTPMIDEAVTGLALAVKEIEYKPDEA